MQNSLSEPCGKASYLNNYVKRVTGDLRKGEVHIGKKHTEVCAKGYLPMGNLPIGKMHIRIFEHKEKCTWGSLGLAYEKVLEYKKYTVL